MNSQSRKHDLAMPPSVPLDQNPAVVYLASLAESSRRTIQQSLDTLAAILSDDQLDALALNWGMLRESHTQAVRARLAERYKPATANKMLSALRQVLFHAWELDQIGIEDYERACAVENLDGAAITPERVLTVNELAILLEVCRDDTTPAGARDAAMIAVMVVMGLRRAEVVALERADYDAATGTLYAPDEGENEPAYVLPEGGRRAVSDWLVERGDVPGPLFWPINRGGTMANRRMSAQAVYNLLVKRADQAGIRHFSPDDLRQTLADDVPYGGRRQQRMDGM